MYDMIEASQRIADRLLEESAEIEQAFYSESPDDAFCALVARWDKEATEAFYGGKNE